jgi:FMN phosphatase YigB (HAD superfamily)
MKIIVDFDDTIFNTYQLIQEFAEIFEEEQFSKEQFWDVYKECKNIIGGFDKRTIINLFSKIKSFNKENTSGEIDSIIEKSSDFVYPDFFDFIKGFNKKDLILLSFGATDFQRVKIKNSGIIPYFQEIIITGKDKADNLNNILIKNKSEKTFFIDDKAEQIDNVKEKFSQVISMKMERPQGGHINTKSKLADHIVKDLNDAKDIISRIPSF